MSKLNQFSEFMNINGQSQFLSIRSTRKNLPILLYLHGGPGDAALPLVTKYNRSLEDIFTVVVWEQRGTGKSYYPFRSDEKITIGLFVEDVNRITDYLLQKFQQKKLYLVGHSWGSVLGFLFCQQYPDKIHAYIGCGQVVNMKKSSKLGLEYAMQEALKAGNMKTVQKLKRIDCTYQSESWLNDLLFVTKQVVKYKGSLYGHKSYMPFIKDFIFSNAYTLRDLLNRQKGSLQSIVHLWTELMTIDFENITSIPVPIIFMEGRYDYHVSSSLAKEYFDTIVTPKQFNWFENSCHFPQWSQADRFTRLLNAVLHEFP